MPCSPNVIPVIFRPSRPSPLALYRNPGATRLASLALAPGFHIARLRRSLPTFVQSPREVQLDVPNTYRPTSSTTLASVHSYSVSICLRIPLALQPALSVERNPLRRQSSRVLQLDLDLDRPARRPNRFPYRGLFRIQR